MTVSFQVTYDDGQTAWEATKFGARLEGAVGY